jgi:hypothetical protein
VAADGPAAAPPPARDAADPLGHAGHGIDGFGLVLLSVDVALTVVLAVFMLRRRRAR